MHKTRKAFDENPSKQALENALWSIRGLLNQSEHIEVDLKENIFEILNLGVKQLDEIK